MWEKTWKGPLILYNVIVIHIWEWSPILYNWDHDAINWTDQFLFFLLKKLFIQHKGKLHKIKPFKDLSSSLDLAREWAYDRPSQRVTHIGGSIHMADSNRYKQAYDVFT